jgi:hypothetical protein
MGILGAPSGGTALIAAAASIAKAPQAQGAFCRMCLDQMEWSLTFRDGMDW